MARASLLVLGLVALLCLSTTVDAWGSDGHKIVAQIAQTFLTSAAQAAVQKQLVCRRYRRLLAAAAVHSNHVHCAAWL